jgi:hypothetical protein
LTTETNLATYVTHCGCGRLSAEVPRGDLVVFEFEAEETFVVFEGISEAIGSGIAHVVIAEVQLGESLICLERLRQGTSSFVRHMVLDTVENQYWAGSAK